MMSGKIDQSTSSIRRHGVWSYAAWVALGLVVAGCHDRNAVARVGKTDIHQSDVEEYLATHVRATQPSAALDALVGRQFLAEAATREKLADKPEVAARLAAARRELLAQAYLESKLAAAVSDEVLERRYEAEKTQFAKRLVHVQIVTIRLARGAEARAASEARARANLAFARAASGEDFARIAAELSDDHATSSRGGDLGWISEGQVDATFFEAAWALKKGEIAKPFETPFGLHVIKALEEPKTELPSFQSVKPTLAAEARREAEAQLMEKLRLQVPVEKHPERMKNPISVAGGMQR
ncbi:MAG: peptidylprolyl isomerase [Deltaproteobacteria bacterium]|nr:peptidylprolyl isomerase [Deltaproteobacteria bacterium]